jgi:hypothetical protein
MHGVQRVGTVRVFGLHFVQEISTPGAWNGHAGSYFILFKLSATSINLLPSFSRKASNQ